MEFDEQPYIIDSLERQAVPADSSISQDKRFSFSREEFDSPIRHHCSNRSYEESKSNEPDIKLRGETCT